MLNLTGDISEAQFVAQCLENGIMVLRPIGVERYDYVVHSNGFHRIQVKTARPNTGNKWRISLQTSARNRTKKYTSDEIDYFAAYIPTTKEIFIAHIDDLPSQTNINVTSKHFTPLSEDSFVQNPKETDSKGPDLAS